MTEHGLNLSLGSGLSPVIAHLCLFLHTLLFVDGIVLIGNKQDVHFNKRLESDAFVKYRSVSVEACFSECERRVICGSINYNRYTSTCELNDAGELSFLATTQTGNRIGWVFVEKRNPVVPIKCGQDMCTGNQVCDHATNSCVFKECSDVVRAPTHGTVLGSMNLVGSKLLLSCDPGFILRSDNNYHVTLTSECLHTGSWSTMDFDCRPATCQVRGQLSPTPTSGLYLYTDEITDELIHIYCDFHVGFGYTFISKTDFGKISSLDIHYTRTDYVVLRHFRQDGIQKEANVSVLPLYSDLYNVTLLLDEYTDFTNPKSVVLRPYIIVGFVPNRHGNKRGQTHGYLCNNVEISYNNCDTNKNNYMAVFSGTTAQNFNIPDIYFTVGYSWVSLAVTVNSSRHIPKEFFGLFEMGMGGCGAFMSSDYKRGEDTALGVSVGMRFDF